MRSIKRSVIAGMSLFSLALAQGNYVGEIRPFGSQFCPAGWTELNGQSLLISEHTDLFNLIGTTYGGDGQDYFNVPDMRGRMAVGQGNGKSHGESGGSNTVTLSIQQMPSHSHSSLQIPIALEIPVSDTTTASPTTKRYLGPMDRDAYRDTSVISAATWTGSKIKANIVAKQLPAGGSQPVDITSARLGLIHCISLTGVYPSVN
jgi:microcystin-dependent protein